jgi:hypothetical protein
MLACAIVPASAGYPLAVGVHQFDHMLQAGSAFRADTNGAINHARGENHIGIAGHQILDGGLDFLMGDNVAGTDNHDPDKLTGGLHCTLKHPHQR